MTLFEGVQVRDSRHMLSLYGVCVRIAAAAEQEEDHGHDVYLATVTAISQRRLRDLQKLEAYILSASKRLARRKQRAFLSFPAPAAIDLIDEIDRRQKLLLVKNETPKLQSFSRRTRERAIARLRLLVEIPAKAA